MSTVTYSPKRLVIVVAGQQVTGFSDDDIVTVTLDEDKFVKYVGVDGPVSRSFNVADTGKFVFTLSHVSEANKIFTDLLLADVLSSTGDLTFPVQVLDGNGEGGTFYNGTDCWVTGMPESGYGKEIGSRVWTLDASRISYNIAGNGSNLLGDVLSGLQGLSNVLS